MRSLGIHLTGVGILIAEHIACELYHHHLHAEADAEGRDVVLSCVVGSDDLAFYTALTEARADDDTVLTCKHLGNICLCNFLGVDECHHCLAVVIYAGMEQRFAY